MRVQLNPDIQSRAIQRHLRQAGFSLLEILVVIGIVGILVGFGAVNYVSQLSQSRVDTGIQILNANFKQARQSAIAMRQNRRVVIDTGTLSGMEEETGPKTLSGVRVDPIQIWIEAKSCEEYPFDSKAYCLPGGAAKVNAYPLTDPETFPDGIMIADVDGIIPGLGTNPRVFYVEFNARGAIEKVYFDGKEAQTLYNQIQPVIHLAKAGEVFDIGSKHGDYSESMEKMSSSSLKWENPPSEESKQRYKVQTIEIVRLTGKTRIYDYAVMNPWPIDEFIK